MQTRVKARQAVNSEQQLPNIPPEVQQIILDHIARTFPEPDHVEYSLWPYKSTLGWLLSLRLVCKQWKQHITKHPSCIRRCRLEALRNLSLLHDYAHIIVTRRCSKSARIKAVPRKVTLQFEDSSSTAFWVPKGLTEEELVRGLPENTLMLATCYNRLTVAAFKLLLADIDCLDQHHSAPMVLKVTRAAPAHSNARAVQASPEAGTQAHEQAAQSSTAAGEAGLLEGATAEAVYASSPQQLADLARPMLQTSLRHIVMEHSKAPKPLCFIPTKRGFTRRVPLGRG